MKTQLLFYLFNLFTFSCITSLNAMDAALDTQQVLESRFDELLSLLSNKKDTEKHQRQDAKNKLSMLNLKALALKTSQNTLPALYKAVSASSYSTAEKLLEAGANPNILVGSQPETPTPLHLASFLGNYNVVELLLRYGAQTQTQNSKFARPLDIAVQHSHVGVVQVLLEYGADTNTFLGNLTPLGLALTPDLNPNNPIPLKVLANNNLRTIVKMLIEHNPQKASIDPIKTMWSEVRRDDFRKLLSDFLTLTCASMSDSEQSPTIKRNNELYTSGTCSPQAKISRWAYDFLLTCLRARRKDELKQLEALYSPIRSSESFRSNLEDEIRKQRETRAAKSKIKNVDKSDKATIRDVLERLSASQSSGMPLVSGAYTREDVKSAESQRDTQNARVSRIKEKLEARTQTAKVDNLATSLAERIAADPKNLASENNA